MKRIVLFIILLPVIIPSVLLNIMWFGWLTDVELVDRFTDWIIDE